MEKKIKPSDLQADAQRLIKSGRMPTVAELLKAIENTRSKYRAAGYKVSTEYPLRDMKRRGNRL